QAANSPDMANRYHAMQTRFKKFEDAGPPPEPPREQDIRMRLRGGRTGVRETRGAPGRGSRDMAAGCAGIGASKPVRETRGPSGNVDKGKGHT
ncbi:hypothetical protein ACFWDV_20250, partial [Streptomyces diastaticus]|uniref:hypothetical protein n=1 Tax=Streptomyces diastaticus TaxID=1956 RepID=UPI003646C897